MILEAFSNLMNSVKCFVLRNCLPSESLQLRRVNEQAFSLFDL